MKSFKLFLFSVIFFSSFTNIYECAVSRPCKVVCTNSPGSFRFYCPKGFAGDGREDDTGCRPKRQANWSANIYFAVGIILLAPALASTWIVATEKKKREEKHRENLFKRNGGKLLEKRRRRHRLNLYTAEEMREATNNYSNRRVMGRCNPGTFYHGTLAGRNDNKEVVIMKIQKVPESKIGQFIDELIFLSRSTSGDFVKILGCCLQTDFPLLVYELHGGGNSTLFDRIHDVATAPQFSCEMRVKAAAGAARGLAYLRSQNSRPSFVHGNICSANILLNDSFGAKIFYVAGSRLIPRDSSGLEICNAYKDPEFIKSSQLDKKSDVYNFGVVLAELLTGGKAFAPDCHQIDREVALGFINMAKEGRLRAILDNIEQITERDVRLMKEVAIQAERCLSVKPIDRPKMEKVAKKLGGCCN